MARHIYTLPASADRIVDGDSIVVHAGIMPGVELHGIHVRLQGINAPELRHEGGPAARDYLTSLLPEGAAITLVSSQEDKYGRLLSAVILDSGESVSELMLAAGHAVPMAS